MLNRHPDPIRTHKRTHTKPHARAHTHTHTHTQHTHTPEVDGATVGIEKDIEFILP